MRASVAEARTRAVSGALGLGRTRFEQLPRQRGRALQECGALFGSGACQRRLEQLAYDSERELLLDVTATRPQDPRPARSAIWPAACRSAVFPIPAGPPITKARPPQCPRGGSPPAVRRSSGSRSSNMSVRRLSTNPVFPPGQRQTQPPCPAGVYCARGDRRGSRGTGPTAVRAATSEEVGQRSDSRPWGASKRSAGHTATSPLGLIIGWVR